MNFLLIQNLEELPPNINPVISLTLHEAYDFFTLKYL
jgi:hypothetical protein